MSPQRSVSYKYDDLNVVIRSLPQGERRVRLENLVGGNTPTYLFAGIIPTDCLDGDNSSETISFTRNGLTSFDLALNGASCHGFPMVRLIM